MTALRMVACLSLFVVGTAHAQVQPQVQPQVRPESQVSDRSSMPDRMKACDDMKRSMAAGRPMTPAMTKLMEQCRDMDSQMGAPAPTPAPSATLDR